MRRVRIFLPLALAPGSEVELDERASRHVYRVLRMRPGEELQLFDGSGLEATAELIRVGKQGVAAHIKGTVAKDVESPLSIELGQAVSRGERMDFVMQKSVELGAATIAPLWTERTQCRLEGERLERRLSHWRGVVTSACEQCGRSRLPKLRPPAALEHWVREQSPSALGLVLEPEGGIALPALPRPAGPVRLLIGPEGGLTRQELSWAEDCGFLRITLGPRILRTETAALTALAVVQSLWGDLGGGAP